MRSKPGPVGKGDRLQHTLRMPRTQLVYYRRLASAAGLDLNDYLVLKLAEIHELELPAYLKGHGQPQLALGA